AELAPLLADWNYAPERGEHCLRRDLAILADFHPDEGESVSARVWLEPLERAFELAQEPVARRALAGESSAEEAEAQGSWACWTMGIQLLDERHAVRNVVLTALAVAQSHAEHGAWPASLTEIDDLPFEEELDTLTGAPLAYSTEGDGARVGPASLFAGSTTWEGASEPLHVWTLR